MCQKGAKIPNQTFKKYPRNGFFWLDFSCKLSPSWQKGWDDLLEKYGCGRALEQGEDLESLDILGGEQVFGVTYGGKSSFYMGTKGI